MAQILGPLLQELFIEEVKAGVGVQLDIEIVAGGVVSFEEKGLVVLVDDEEVVELNWVWLIDWGFVVWFHEMIFDIQL